MKLGVDAAMLDGRKTDVTGSLPYPVAGGFGLRLGCLRRWGLGRAMMLSVLFVGAAAAAERDLRILRASRLIF